MQKLAALLRSYPVKRTPLYSNFVLKEREILWNIQTSMLWYLPILKWCGWLYIWFGHRILPAFIYVCICRNWKWTWPLNIVGMPYLYVFISKYENKHKSLNWNKVDKRCLTKKLFKKKKLRMNNTTSTPCPIGMPIWNRQTETRLNAPRLVNFLSYMILMLIWYQLPHLPKMAKMK